MQTTCGAFDPTPLHAAKPAPTHLLMPLMIHGELGHLNGHCEVSLFYPLAHVALQGEHTPNIKLNRAVTCCHALIPLSVLTSIHKSMKNILTVLKE